MWPFRKRDPRPRRGDTIISIDARGCMATDRRVRWVGRAEAFEPADLFSPRSATLIHCRVDLLPGGGKPPAQSVVMEGLTPVSRGVWAEII